MPLSDAEQKVCRIIRDRERALLDDLRLHVGIPTGGRHTEGLDESRERLAARAKALGATVDLYEGDPRPAWLFAEGAGEDPLPTAVCRRHEGVSGHEVLLCGHLDTVHDPRGRFRELALADDGRTATGPGCVDMKGGLVVGLAALEALEEAGVCVPWTLLLNSDEETGSYHSARAIIAEAERVRTANGVGVALEPATPDGGLVVERGGSGQFMVEVRGRAAHVGRDFRSGISAVYKLAEVLMVLNRLNDPSEWPEAAKAGGGGGLVVNVGPLQGGRSTNVVPDVARAWGNVRFWNVEVAGWFQAVLDHAESPAGDVADDRGLAKVKFQTSYPRPPKPMTPEVARFAQNVRAIADDLGQALPFTRTGGVCDGNLMHAAGLPTLDTLGVRGGGLHTEQEWIEVPSLVERCQLLAVLLMRAGR
jgi:glutamate carboxypeptidase